MVFDIETVCVPFVVRCTFVCLDTTVYLRCACELDCIEAAKGDGIKGFKGKIEK